MNEASGFRSAGLSRQQKLAQQASVYGLDPEIWAPSGKGQRLNMTPAAGSFTPEQLEQMRQILAQHGNSGLGGNKEFDLASPPTAQYRHQEFPKAMYKEGLPSRNAANAAEEEAAIAAGWSTRPPVAEAAPFDPWEGLSADDRAKAQEIDQRLAEVIPEREKNKGGRPRKPVVVAE